MRLSKTSLSKIFCTKKQKSTEKCIQISFNQKHRRKKITVRDFEPLSIIGRGAFGEVRICRFKETGEVIAMKKMKKSEMLYKNQVAHVKAERDVLIRAKNSWVVDLKYSF